MVAAALCVAGSEWILYTDDGGWPKICANGITDISGLARENLSYTVDFYFGFKDAVFRPCRTGICTWSWSGITRGRSRNLARWFLTDARKVFGTAINGIRVSNRNYVLQYFCL